MAKKPKTIMRSLRIDEISSVDRPAQEGAQMVLMKREGEDIKKGERVVLLTSVDEGHAHVVWLYGDEFGGTTGYSKTPDEDQEHGHPWVMDKSGNIVIAMNDGHDHTVAENEFSQALMAMAATQLALRIAQQIGREEYNAEKRQEAIDKGHALTDGSFPICTAEDIEIAVGAFKRAKDAELVARHIAKRAEDLDMMDELPEEGELATLLQKFYASDDAADGGGDGLTKENPMTKEKTEKAAEEQKAALEKIQKDLATATAYGKLSDAGKVYYETLDEKGKEGFLAKSADDQKKLVSDYTKNLADENPVIYKGRDGTEYRKNDDPRFVAMAKRTDAAEERADKAEKKADAADLRKRAETDLKYLPGDVETRMELIKAVDSISDEDVRKKSLEALKAQNESMSKAFQTFGHTNGGTSEPAGDTPDAQLEALAKKYAEEHKCDEATAMDQILKTDEGKTLYKQSVEPDAASIH